MLIHVVCYGVTHCTLKLILFTYYQFKVSVKMQEVNYDWVDSPLESLMFIFRIVMTHPC